MTHEKRYLKWEGFGNTEAIEKRLAPTKPWMRLGNWEHHFLTGSVREHIFPLHMSHGERRFGAVCFYQVSKIGSKL